MPDTIVTFRDGSKRTFKHGGGVQVLPTFITILNDNDPPLPIAMFAADLIQSVEMAGNDAPETGIVLAQPR